MTQHRGPGWWRERQRHREASLKGWRGRRSGYAPRQARTSMVSQSGHQNKHDIDKETEEIIAIEREMRIGEIDHELEAIRTSARKRGHMTDDETYREEKLNDELIALRLGKNGGSPRTSMVRRAETSSGNVDKSGKLPGYKTRLVKYGPKTYEIPYDPKTGKVPEEVIIARFLNVQEGDRGGGRRNTIIDQGENAKIKVPKSSTPEEIVDWWAHPNESDVDSIDTIGAEAFHLDPNVLKTTGAKEVHRGIAIVGGTEQQRATIRKSIESGFTVKEQKMIKGMTIVIADLPSGISGMYYGKVYGGNYLIKVDKDTGVNADTVSHEMVHHLREVDAERTSKLTKARPYYGKDKDLEEAATTAESVTRHRPFDWRNRGYYSFMDQEGNTKKIQDRGTLTDQEVKKTEAGRITQEDNIHLEDKSKRGKRALKSMDKNFKQTNIAHLNITGGKKEAIDQYYTIEESGQKVNIQMYSPRGHKELPKISEGETLYEWRDGKRVKVDSEPVRLQTVTVVSKNKTALRRKTLA